MPDRSPLRVFAIAGAITLAACATAPTHATAPIVDAVVRDYAALTLMTTDAALQPASPLCVGPSYPPSQTRSPHDGFGTVLRVYMNAAAAKAFPATRASPRRADFPVGSVIVKEKALTDSAKTKLAVAGMIKRAPGYDPAAGDWEFFYVEPGGPIDQGPIETCRSCHGGAAPRDRVFGSWAGGA